MKNQDEKQRSKAREWWDKIPGWGRWFSGVAFGLSALAGAIGWTYAQVDELHTDAESVILAEADQVARGEILEELHDYQAQQVEADTQRLIESRRTRAQVAQDNIDALEYELLGGAFTDQEREYKKRLIDREEAKLVCIPKGEC